MAQAQINSAREIRRAFIPRQGNTFVCIDYDQIEMRVFAHFSKCQNIIDRINNGFDPHLGTAIDIFGEELVYKNDTLKKFTRTASKGINFGIIYGMGINKLKEQLFGIMFELKKELPNNYVLPTPQEILSSYYKQYPVKEYMAEVTGQLYRKGYITISFTSDRMCFIRDYRVPQHLAYKGVNVIVQGTSAYIMKFGMKRAYNKIKAETNKVLFLGTIHDELIWEIPTNKLLKKCIQLIKTEMEDKVTFSVPILASVKTSTKSWGDCKETII